MAIAPGRYSDGLLRVAIELNKVDEFESQLELLVNDILNNDFYEIINYPNYPLSKKIELINKLTKQYVDDYIVNFMILLLKSERINIMGQIARTYKELADEYRNTQVVEVTSAFELESDQIDRIVDKIKAMYNLENIRIKTVIDPQVLGGIKIKKGDTVIDGTIKSRLDIMKNIISKNI